MAEIRLDYATINFPAGKMSLPCVSKTLAPDCNLKWEQLGRTENAPWNSPLGLYWQENNGYAELPHRLSISGVGCEKFALTIPDLTLIDGCRFSRIDFAFDVLMDKDKWKEFIKSFVIASLDSDRKLKKFTFTGSGEAMTVYIGSRKSDKFFRIYNKSLEDKKFKIASESGDVKCPDDKYIIRYEIELKRVKRPAGVFDPSPLFYSYYSDDHSQLFKFVKDAWLSYGNEVLLPYDFINYEFTCRFDKLKILFNREVLASGKNVFTPADSIKEKLHDFPHEFDKTLAYVVDHYGSYLPYVMLDDEYRECCLRMCERKFGLKPDWIFESKPPTGFYDLDIDDEYENPWSNNSSFYEQIDIDI